MSDVLFGFDLQVFVLQNLASHAAEYFESGWCIKSFSYKVIVLKTVKLSLQNASCANCNVLHFVHS